MRESYLVTSFIGLMFLFGLPLLASAQGGGVRLGLVHVFSGPMATFGQVAQQGAELAVKEINDNGGILGRPVRLLVEDTAANPDVSEKAVEKVDALIGIVSSAVALRVAPDMVRLKCPLIVTHAMAEEITTTLKNPWVFRLTWNLDQCYYSSALLAKQLGAKRWTTIGPDYGFGQESWKYFKQYRSGLGSYSFDEGVFTPSPPRTGGRL